MFKFQERLPLSGRVGYIGLGFFVALAVTVTAQQSGSLAPASSSQDCDLKRAAEFAIQANLKMINGSTVNPGKYFSPGGQDSCISGVMLQSFDLSSLIPDFGNILSGAIEGAINTAINGAANKVCNAVNGAVQSTVGGLNGSINEINAMLSTDQNFQNLLSSELGFGGGIGGSYAGGTTYTSTGASSNAFGLSGTTATGNNGTGGSGNTSGVTNNFGSSTQSSTQAVALAAASEQARLGMEDAWNNYVNVAQNGYWWGNPNNAYQDYVNSVNNYNTAIQAEMSAQAGTTFGSGSNTYSGLQMVSPKPKVGTGSTSGGFWGNLF